MTKKYDIKVLDNRRDVDRVFLNFNERGLNILFTKVLTNLKLGENCFSIPYDTTFISNRNKLLLLLNEKDQERFIKKLKENSIEYHEVNFQDETYEYRPPQDNKKLVFKESLKDLKETLKDSQKHGRNECIYYPNVNGKLNIRYYLKDDSKEILMVKDIEGLIEFDNRIVLCLKQEEKTDVNYKNILKLFNELNMTVSISEDTEYRSIRKEKELIK